MGSPIQAILAQAAAGAGVTGTSTEELCKEAGTNQRKREALGCPELADGVETVNKPTVETPGDPDVGAEVPAGGAEGQEEYKPSTLDIALRKQEMKLPLTEEEQQVLLIHQKQQEAEASQAPAAEPGMWERAMGWLGMGK